AHPDDPEISCGGTLARWAAAGSEVHLLLLTRGDKGSSDPADDPDALASRRLGEVAAAAAVLGLAGHARLDVDDGDLANDAAVRREIVAVVRRVRPDVVICPDPTAVFFGDTYFNHRDHRVAGWATLDAVSPAAGSPHYFPDAGPAHAVGQVLLSGTLEPNVWVDVGDTLETKVRALLCHESQLQAAAFGHEGGTAELFGDVLRQRAEDGGRLAGVPYAEGFRRLLLG
ncbi:MAG: PIG-L deacetylase family protein, partial [Acidimicrobiales bacterium]